MSKDEKQSTENRDRDEPIKLPLDAETALRGLLTVKPEQDDQASGEDKP